MMDRVLNGLWAAQRALAVALGVPATLLVRLLSLAWAGSRPHEPR